MTPREIVKHCWTCRRETTHRHVEQITSRTLYACTTEGCRAPHREVTDPSSIGRSLAAIAEQSAARSTHVTRTLEDIEPGVKIQRLRLTAPKQEKPIMPKPTFENPIHKTIDALLADRLKDLVTKEEFDELADKVKTAATPKDLDQHVERIIEKILPDRINAALLQLLAVPKKSGGAIGGKTRGLELSGPCPRQPHKGKCPSAWCISAEKKAAAEKADE